MMGDICRGCLHLSTVHQLHSNYSPECRAGHPTILSRLRDHVSRPQSCSLLQYYYIYLATPSRHLDLDIFRIYSCPRGSITLSRCCVVVVAKLKNCCMPSSAQMFTFNWYTNHRDIEIWELRSMGTLEDKHIVIWASRNIPNRFWGVRGTLWSH